MLRPAATKAIDTPDGSKDKPGTAEHQMIDMADANAVQEVDLAYENFKEIDPLDVTKDGVESWETALKRYNLLLEGNLFLSNNFSDEKDDEAD